MVVTAVCVQFLNQGFGMGFSAPSLGQVKIFDNHGDDHDGDDHHHGMVLITMIMMVSDDDEDGNMATRYIEFFLKA